MSTQLQQNDIAIIVTLLSSERLSAFYRITNTHESAIELHQEMLHINKCLMAIIAVLEIATRNAICDLLQRQFGGHVGWLRTPPAPFAWKPSEQSKIGKALSDAQRAKYAKLGHQDKVALDALAYPNGGAEQHTHDEKSKARRKVLPVNDGDIVAQLTLAFWKKLFSSEYQESLWKRSLKKIFPDKTIDRAEVAGHFEVIYQARNRIAHHEPIYDQRLTSVVASIAFVLDKFGQKDQTGLTPLAKLLNSDLQVLTAAVQALEGKLATFRGATAPAAPA